AIHPAERPGKSLRRHLACRDSRLAVSEGWPTRSPIAWHYWGIALLPRHQPRPTAFPTQEGGGARPTRHDRGCEDEPDAGRNRGQRRAQRATRTMLPRVDWAVIDPVGLGARSPSANSPVFLRVTARCQAGAIVTLPVVVDAVSVALVARGSERVMVPAT